MSMTELYLKAFDTATGCQADCNLETYIILCLTKHIDSQADAINVHLVLTENQKVHITLEDDAIAKKCKVIQYEDCPWTIQQCSLPALLSHDGLLVHSGVCSVLRSILWNVYRKTEDPAILSLLGFKQGCLKACAEVSPWTKFCEIDYPNALETFFSQLSDPYESLILPDEFIMLENHIRNPPSLFNKGKAKKDWDKRMKITTNAEILSLSEDNISSDDTVKVAVVSITDDLEDLKLKYPFLEGVKMTLTDFILFWCFDLIWVCLGNRSKEIASLLPHTVKWYNNIITSSNTLRRFNGISLSAGLAQQCPLKKTPTIVLPKNTDSRINIRTRRTRHNCPKPHPSNVKVLVNKFKDSQLVITNQLRLLEDVHIDWLVVPGPVHPAQGNLGDRTQKKCQQLENMATAVMKLAKPGDVIVDFCSGGGHLGIVLSHFLPKCKIVLVDNKEESILRGMGRIKEMGTSNITQYQCNLDFFRGKFDIGVCLHGCGMVTDLVLEACIRNSASFVVCPCCYGAIQNTHTITFPRSEDFKTFGIQSEEYLTLAHAGDQTESSLKTTERGFYCMDIIDTDRLFDARFHGYDVKLTKLHPVTCSPKNNILIGSKQKLSQYKT